MPAEFGVPLGTPEGRQGRKPLLNHKIYRSPERRERAVEGVALIISFHYFVSVES